MLVNNTTKKCAPKDAMYQIGSVLLRIIEAPEGDDDIIFSKLDIKDGFLHMVCEEGQEWNFPYIPPNYHG